MDHTQGHEEQNATPQRLVDRERGIDTSGAGYVVDVQSFEAPGLYWLVRGLLSIGDVDGLSHRAHG